MAKRKKKILSIAISNVKVIVSTSAVPFDSLRQWSPTFLAMRTVERSVKRFADRQGPLSDRSTGREGGVLAEFFRPGAGWGGWGAGRARGHFAALFHSGLCVFGLK